MIKLTLDFDAHLAYFCNVIPRLYNMITRAENGVASKRFVVR
jgi:hypothetical protein